MTTKLNRSKRTPADREKWAERRRLAEENDPERLGRRREDLSVPEGLHVFFAAAWKKLYREMKALPDGPDFLKLSHAEQFRFLRDLVEEVMHSDNIDGVRLRGEKRPSPGIVMTETSTGISIDCNPTAPRSVIIDCYEFFPDVTLRALTLFRPRARELLKKGPTFYYGGLGIFTGKMSDLAKEGRDEAMRADRAYFAEIAAKAGKKTANESFQ